jgi:hypothetical protein
MAIKILGTEVIDNSRVLKNIAGGTFYDELYPNTVTVTNTVDIRKPVHYCNMTSSFTFTINNKDTGLSTVLILDRSASSYTPAFPSEVLWPGGTQPTWSDHRYWNISLICFSSSIVFGGASGFDA